MQAERIDRETLRVPMRAEGDDGEIGHAMVVLRRDDDPDTFDRWADWLDRR